MAWFYQPLLLSLGSEGFTGAAAVTVSAATASGSAQHVTPTYTGTAAVTVSAATASGAATFTGLTFTATAAVTVSAATASGSATFTGGSPPVVVKRNLVFGFLRTRRMEGLT